MQCDVLSVCVRDDSQLLPKHTVFWPSVKVMEIFPGLFSELRLGVRIETNSYSTVDANMADTCTYLNTQAKKHSLRAIIGNNLHTRTSPLEVVCYYSIQGLHIMAYSVHDEHLVFVFAHFDSSSPLF